MVERNWLRQSAEVMGQTERMVAEFASVYRDLGLSQNDFAGTVLAAGVEPIFPERAFICSPSSRYKEIHPWVKKLVLCDVDHYERYGILKEPVTIQIPYEEGEQEIADGKVVSIQDSIWEILKIIKLNYDAITFCRVPDLPHQLRGERLQLIADRLKPGGLALLSGSFAYEYEDMDLAQFVNIANSIPRINATLHKLVSGGDPLNLGHGGHYAVVIRKGL